MKNKRNARKQTKVPQNLKALKRGVTALFKGADQSLSHKDICRQLQVKDKITKHQILFVIKNLGTLILCLIATFNEYGFMSA